MLGNFKSGVRAAFDPMGRALVRVGVSPDTVTVVGTAAIVVSSVLLTARGYLALAAVVITICALLDVLDGAMARARGPSNNRYGALLDSVMDRVADGAIFAGLVWWLARTGQWTLVALALVCLVGGQVISYTRARAEGLGYTATVGIAERMERLILIGLGALTTGLGLHWGLAVALWILVVLTMVTAAQRLTHVKRQAQAQAQAEAEAPVEAPDTQQVTT
jgi:CDP-diacylglycerol--glycerol-3-phosphate 3-phosphatidyltransferase